MSYAGIVFFGRAGSGKTLGASIASKLIAEQYKGIVIQYSFMRPVKKMIGNLPIVNMYELLKNREYKSTNIPGIDKSPRYLMQTLGTEWGRDLVHQDLWTMCASQFIDNIAKAEELSGSTTQPPLIIIDDGRFDNELDWAIANDFFVIVLQNEEVLEDQEHPTENLPTTHMLTLAHNWFCNNKKEGKINYERRLREVLVKAKFISE